MDSTRPFRARPGRRFVCATTTLLVGAFHASLALATPGPGPGQPFGGNDGGCVPLRSELERCSDTVAKAYTTLEKSTTKCHESMAVYTYAHAILGKPKFFDVDGCENAALARFDKTLADLGASGKCSASSLLTTAVDAEAALADSLDARGTDLYCDATSGKVFTLVGDEPGYIPATRIALGCTKRISSSLAKLAIGVARCHQTAAADGFTLADPPFDEDACEAAARAKYDKTATQMAGSGHCPACLGAAALSALADTAQTRLDADNASLYPCPDPVLHVGTAVLDRPTLMALGVQLPISGDENRNGSVALRYRVVGSPGWTDALPLLRVKPETVPSGGNVIAEQFAGSIFDLRPATDYELELHAVDADGGVDETQTLTATTRAEPADPVSPHAVAVTSASELTAALASAAAGDVITIADGEYHGAFAIEADGTESDPIVIRGASRDGTVLDGDDCLCNVLEVYGSHVHVEKLTLRHAQRALRFQSTGAIDDVARGLHTIDTRLGIATREGQYDFYICDNVLEGRLVWPQVYTDDDGLHANDDGINVQGYGHVVCHNRLSGFGDAMKTELLGARSVDFYGNEVLSAYDNGLELDLSEGNVRAWRNRFTNTFSTLSFQPIYGGPAYALRNVIVNVANEQMKFHGLGPANGPSGVLAYNNTFVSPGMALQVSTDATSHNFEIRNNLFVGPSVLGGTRTVDWTAPIVGGLFDSDGYFPDGGFRFNLAPGGLVPWPSFDAMQAGGMETAGVLLTEPIFASGLVGPSSYTSALAAADVTLDATSNAIDAGVVLPGVTDHYVGAAPDLGAVESGCPLPIYGVRPDGIDDSNEPVGCE